MKIRYTRTTTFVPPLKFTENGDWVDLSLAEDADLQPGEFKPVSLGIRVQLPKGFEAHIVPRSSTGKRHKVLQYNSMGVVDESYQGPNDIWHMLLYSPGRTYIPTGTRVCQFRIMPKMKASVWVKLKWLFTNRIKFVEVEDFKAKNRGGLGSTG